MSSFQSARKYTLTSVKLKNEILSQTHISPILLQRLETIIHNRIEFEKLFLRLMEQDIVYTGIEQI